MLPTPKEVFTEKQLKIHNDKWKVFPIDKEEYIRFLEEAYDEMRAKLIICWT